MISFCIMECNYCILQHTETSIFINKFNFTHLTHYSQVLCHLFFTCEPKGGQTHHNTSLVLLLASSQKNNEELNGCDIKCTTPTSVHIIKRNPNRWIMNSLTVMSHFIMFLMVSINSSNVPNIYFFHSYIFNIIRGKRYFPSF